MGDQSTPIWYIKNSACQANSASAALNWLCLVDQSDTCIAPDIFYLDEKMILLLLTLVTNKKTQIILSQQPHLSQGEEKGINSPFS